MTLLPLVGRESELAVLDDLVARVGEFGGALVVRGEAGIGKSALLQAASSWDKVVARLHDDGYRTATPTLDLLSLDSDIATAGQFTKLIKHAGRVTTR
jgi:AAA ATPase domain